MERVEGESVSCRHEKRGISDLDIREWGILLRDNDLRLEEQNVMKKEMLIEKHSLEETMKSKKAKDELNIKEIQIEEELRILTEKKQDMLTFIRLDPTILQGYDFEISYRVCGTAVEEEEQNQNSGMLDACDLSLDFNEEKGTGLGGKLSEWLFRIFDA